MDVLLVTKENRKTILKIWQDAREDESVVNIIEKGKFNEDAKKGKLYKEFYSFWSDTTKEEQKLNPKMAIEFYLLLEKTTI